jgi:RNA polymerase sigma factor (sigma-70 family)
MTAARLGTLFAQLDPAAPLSDGQLLERFASQRDERAFAALVRRHGALVLGVGRRVLHRAEDCEDVFQATFLTLARKASSVRWQESVGGWLHEVAYRLARKARSQAARRHAVECEAAARAPTTEAAARELALTLDDELHSLPAPYRAPLVLCYLEGRPTNEAARQLGMPLRTLQRRLEQGRELLRRRLAKKGFTLSAVLLAAALGQAPTPAAVPPPLAASTVRAAFAATGPTPLAGVSARAASLAGAALAATTRARLAAALLLVLALAGGAGVLMQRPPAGAEAPRDNPESRPADNRPARARTDRHGDPLPDDALLRLGTLRWRHGGRIMAVAFSPDGKTLAVGCVDHSVQLRDLATGRSLRTFRGHDGEVSCVRFTPDGKLLLTRAHDRTLRVWDVASGKQLRHWDMPGGWSVAISPDGKSVAGFGAISPTYTIHQWDIATGARLREFPFEGELDGLMTLAFSPDGKRLVSGGDRALRLWDVATGKQLRLFGQGHGQTGTDAIAFSPDGKMVAVGSHDAEVHLWDPDTGKLLRSLPAGTPRVDALAFAPTGKAGPPLLAVAGDRGVRVWDASTGKEKTFLGMAHNDRIWSVAFSSDGKSVATGNESSLVRLWDLQTRKERAAAGGHESPLRVADRLPGDSELLTIEEYGAARVWDAATGRPLRRFDLGDDVWCSCATRSPDGKHLALGGHHFIYLLDAVAGKVVRRLPGHQRHAWGLAYFPDGKTLASIAFLDRAIRLWDTTSGKELRAIHTQHQNGPMSLALAPDGKMLATGGEFDSTICLWDPATRKLLRRWTAHAPAHGHERGVAPLRFSPDGRTLVSAGPDGLIRFWDPATGRKRFELIGWGLLRFSPDGRMMTTTDPDGTIRLWEMATGRERHRLAGHQGHIFSLAFADNGRTLVSGGQDTTALVWDLWAPGGDRRLPSDGASLWNDLAAADAMRAFRALRALRADPEATLALLPRRLRPVAAPDPARVAQLVRDLDSDQFDVRRAAGAELEGLAELAGPELRRVRETSPPLEVRRRLDQLLERLEGPARAPEQVRALRAVELLEVVDGPAAQKLLRSLAGGAEHSRVTAEARLALDRLQARKK